MIRTEYGGQWDLFWERKVDLILEKSFNVNYSVNKPK